MILADIFGPALSSSISDQWLSFESVLFKALFGSRLSEHTYTRTASPLPRTDQCLSNVKDMAYVMKAGLRCKDRECKNKRAAEDRMYRRLEY